MKNITRSTTLSLAALALVTAPASAAVIAGSGFSVDAIVEAGAASPAAGTDHAGFANWVLAESGAPNSAPAGTALPAGGLLSSQFGTLFQLEPYTGPNTLVNGDTFTLDTPGSYSDLQFFITGIGGNGTNNFQATVNFSDASTTLLEFSVRDWQQSHPYNAFATQTDYVRRTSAANLGLWTRELDFTLAPADQSRTIESIDFTLQDRLGLSAVSGTLVPESSAIALLGMAGLVLLRRRRAQ